MGLTATDPGTFITAVMSPYYLLAANIEDFKP